MIGIQIAQSLDHLESRTIALNWRTDLIEGTDVLHGQGKDKIDLTGSQVFECGGNSHAYPY